MTTKVSTDVIELGAITNDKITSLAASKLTGTISNEQIASIATSKLTGTISNAQLAGSITNDKITSLAASKLTGALPAIDGSNLTGVEPPTDYNAVGTYRLIGISTPYVNSTSALFNGIGNTFTSNDYGLSSSQTWRLMGGTVIGTTGALGSTNYNHTILILRVS